MPNYDYKCTKCELEVILSVSYEDRDASQECLCGEPMYRTWRKMPGVTRASYVDGQRRKQFQDLKEANRVEMEALNAKPKDRAAAFNEADRIRKVKS